MAIFPTSSSTIAPKWSITIISLILKKPQKISPSTLAPHVSRTRLAVNETMFHKSINKSTNSTTVYTSINITAKSFKNFTF